MRPAGDTQFSSHAPYVDTATEGRGWSGGLGSVRRTESSDEWSLADRRAILPVAVGVALALAFLLRLSAAERLSPHVDEAASVLAAHAVVERGVPILPSGTVYLQGATLSYLLAPFVWVGAGDLDNLSVMRVVSVFSGTVAVYLAYRLGRTVTGDPRVGVLTGFLVAIDPVSVQWSGHVRMYGLLQTLTFALAWIFVRALVIPPSWPLAAGLVGVFWAAVFTHIGAVLLWPAMALTAVSIHRQSLGGRWRRLSGALALSLLAPVVLVTLNSLLGSASVGGGAAAPSRFLTFVGDNLLAPLGRLRPGSTAPDWAALIRDNNLAWLGPALFVACSSLIAGRSFLIGSREDLDLERRQAISALLALYWVPVIAVGAFTVSPKERYLLHVHLLGYVLVAAVAIELLTRRPAERSGVGWLGRVAVYGFTPVAVASLLGGLVWRFEHPVVHPNHTAAFAYVVAHRAPGEPVIAALPAVAYLALGKSDDLLFLAGPKDGSRAQRYIRPTAGGHLVDYWVGADAIVSPAQLRKTLVAHPDTWVVVDEERLGASWAYAGAMADAIRATTATVYEAPGGALVLRAASVGREPVIATGCGCTGARPW